MSEQGFALITVLWLVAALSIFVGGSMTAARLDIRAAQNRIALERTEWAAEACAAILSERYDADQTVRTTDTIELGDGTWCRATISEPSSRLNINTADEETLESLISEAARVVGQSGRRNQRDQLPINWPDPRPEFSDVTELGYMGVIDEEMLKELTPLLTVRGDGRVNLITADARIIRSLPMLTPSQAARIVAWRSLDRSAPDHTIIAAMLETAERPLSADAYRALVQQTSLAPTVLVIDVEGGLERPPIRGRRTITAIPVGGRLAVVRREVS